MKYRIVILFSCLTFFTTCKKYPDGGFIKRGERNMLGSWKLALYEVNGIDSTDLINYNGDEGYKKVVFKSDIPRNKDPKYMIIDKTNQRTISFVNSNKELEIKNNDVLSGKECNVYYFNTYKCYRTIFCPEGKDSKWQIEKLTKRELILTSLNYKIILIKQS